MITTSKITTISILESHNIELSSAADHDQQSRFLTGQHSQFLASSKATAPTIC